MRPSLGTHPYELGCREDEKLLKGSRYQEPQITFPGFFPYGKGTVAGDNEGIPSQATYPWEEVSPLPTHWVLKSDSV